MARAKPTRRSRSCCAKLMNWYATRHDDYVSAIVKGMGRYQSH